MSENEYLLIKGEAGSGKTTLMKHFAYSLLNEKNRKTLDGWLPVLIFLKDVRDIDLRKDAVRRINSRNVFWFIIW